MNTSLTVRNKVHFTQSGKGRKNLRTGDAPPTPAPGRVPRDDNVGSCATYFSTSNVSPA